MSKSNGAAPRSSPTALTKSVAETIVYYEVAHQMNGRLRLRVPRLAKDAGFAQRLLESVQLLPMIEMARVSSLSSSLVVTYRSDASHIAGNGAPPTDSATMLQLVVECVRSAAGAEVVQEIVTPPMVSHAPPTVDPLSQLLASRSPADVSDAESRINYTKRMSLPVLGLGLSASIMAGLAVPAALVGGAILAAAIPTFKRTAQGIRDEKRLTVDFLDTLTIVLMTAQGSFLAPAFIVGVIEGSEIVRDWTARRSKQASLALLLAQDRQVLVERNGDELWLSWDRIEPGDVIHVYAGDQIPVDGVIQTGGGLLDQRYLTGASAPVACHAGDEVHASALVVDGHLRILVKDTGHDTRAAASLALMNAVPDTDTRVSNYARKVGNWAVPPTLAASAAVFATSGSVARATGIVSLDLGTGMRVSAPIAVVSAQNYAAKRGILIRSGRALEMLSQVNNVVFDKTGTLTAGRVKVVEVRALRPGAEPRTVLQLAASAEHALNHPLARAIAHYAEEQALKLQPTTTWDYLPGLGIAAEIDGQTIHVGSRRWVEQVGIDMDAAFDSHEDAASAATTHVYVARDGDLLGVIRCSDALRPDSAEVVATLRNMRVASFMLSGDSEPVALATAASLGISPRRVSAEALPQQKLERVQELQALGRKVAVVGDGINDAAAMAHADVSIALRSATDLARETADIVLLNDDLRDLITAIEIAQHAMGIIEQNQAIVVAPNIAGIAYGMLAILNPVAGVVINNGSALVAALNSLRPLSGPGAPTTQPATKRVTANHQTNVGVIDA